MKKIFLFFCLSFLSGKVFCQNYKPFPDSNAYWIERHAWLQQNGNCGFAWFDYIGPVYFGSDTIINSITYHSLRTHRMWTITNTMPSMQCPYQYSYNTPDGIFIFFRQDTSAKKVFIYWNNNDILLYDFNLSVGDTLPSAPNNPMYPNVIVTGIDSLLLPDGYRKRFALNVISFSGHYSIIEGIGSTAGLLAPLFPQFENADTILCFSQNSITLFPDTSASCDLTIGIPEQKPEKLFSLSPNPATNFISIKNNFASPLEATVFSSMGNAVFKTTLALNGAETIDVSEWAAGIYLVAVRSDKNFAMRRVVKQ